MKRVSLTTKDNPFDPFEDFIKWNSFDVEKGYNTCSKIARLFNIPNLHTEEQENAELERVIDRLIEIDPLKIYKKVVIYEK